MTIKKSEFMSKINKARKLYEKAHLEEQALFEYLNECFPDIDFEDIHSNFYNGDNVKEAICCYLSYGEYFPEEIYKEIKDMVERW